MKSVPDVLPELKSLFFMDCSNNNRWVEVHSIGTAFEWSSYNTKSGFIFFRKTYEHSHILGITIDKSPSAVDGVYPKTGIFGFNMSFFLKLDG